MTLSRFTWLLWLGLLAPASGWAQGALRDPTLPPPGALPAEAGAQVQVAPAAGPLQAQLQVLLIGPERRHAVLDGHLIKPGERLEQWRLVRITDTGVLMQSGQGPQTISAYPGVSKKMRPDSGPAPRPATTKP